MAETSIDGLIAARLYALRTARRLSQETAAARCGVDHSLLSRLESGRRSVTRESVTKIVTGYGLSVEDADRLYLLAGFVPPDLIAPHVYDTELLRLWRTMRQRNPLAAALEEADRDLDEYNECQERQERHTDHRHDHGEEERDPDE